MTTAEETVHDEYLVPSTSSEIIINDFFFFCSSFYCAQLLTLSLA